MDSSTVLYEGLLPGADHVPFFDDWDIPTAIKLDRFSEFVAELISIGERLQYPIAVSGIILNIAHFLVLTRKSMMDNSINLILAVLAVNDIAVLGFLISDQYDNINVADDNECIPTYRLFYQILHLTRQTVQIHCRRNSSWLAVLMAGIRTICITNVDNPRFSSVTTIKFGAFAILLEFFACTFVTSSIAFPFLFKEVWKPEDDYIWYQHSTCQGYPVYENRSEHHLNRSDDDVAHTYIIDAFSVNVLPCLCYPIFTFYLTKVLISAKRTRARLGQDNGNDRSTFLVICMTISFMIAEIPQSIGYFITANSTSIGCGLIGLRITLLFTNVSYLNACSHCFICFALSSIYRTAVYGILKIKKKAKIRGNHREDIVSTQIGDAVRTQHIS